MVGRLLVMTKTGSHIAPIDKTRPIAVRSLAIRILEKLIKSELDSCKGWENWVIGKYQVGFQRGMGTLVNTMRVKRLIKLYKKNRKENRSIIFTLDIVAAFDWMPREIIL